MEPAINKLYQDETPHSSNSANIDLQNSQLTSQTNIPSFTSDSMLLPDGSIYYCYRDLAPNITKISIIVLDKNEQSIATHELTHNSTDHVFYGICSIPLDAKYRVCAELTNNVNIFFLGSKKVCEEIALPSGPTILPDGSTYFCYKRVDPNIKNMAIVSLDNEGKIIQQDQLTEIHHAPNNSHSFYGHFFLSEGTHYKLLIEHNDNKTVSVIDPAARYLPNGFLHHSSNEACASIYNQDNYRFRYPRPTIDTRHNLLISQIHVGTRTQAGTFKALLDEGVLPKIADLGMNTIQFMPLGPTPGPNWGYDGVAHPFAITSNYGTPDDLKAVIDEAHHLGMKVIFDFVFNHLNGDIKSQQHLFGDATTDGMITWGEKPNLNSALCGLSDFYLDSITYFITNFNIDGMRLDSAYNLPESFVHDLIKTAKKINPDILTIYEGYLTKDNNFFNYSNFFSYDHGSFHVGAILRLFNNKPIYGWKRNEKLGNPTAFHAAAKLSYGGNRRIQIGANQDFIGNESECYRVPRQILNAFPNSTYLGLAALRQALIFGLIAPANLLIFNGDEQGIISAPFPFFQTRIKNNYEILINRMREWRDMIVHDFGDLQFLMDCFYCPESEPRGWKSGWDGSIEQLLEMKNRGFIKKETYESLAHFNPRDIRTFQAAKINSDDFNTKESILWRKAFAELVKFTRTLNSKYDKVFAYSKELLSFTGIKDQYDQPLTVVANITDRVQRLKFDWSGIYTKQKIIFASSHLGLALDSEQVPLNCTNSNILNNLYHNEHGHKIINIATVDADNEFGYLPPFDVAFLIDVAFLKGIKE